MRQVFLADNLTVLKTIPDGSIDLIYIDPPFNTGKVQRLSRITTSSSEEGSRKGFGGRKYVSKLVSNMSYSDNIEGYLPFLAARLKEAYRVLSDRGTIYVHIDYREVHYVKVIMDCIFGRENFVNEIIWAYDYGAKPKNRWPAKHDNILMYVKGPNYFFNVAAIEREPYMAPGMVTKEKQLMGKLPTDCWWHTIVPTNGSERTGYPNQKPLGILRRIIKASSYEGQTVLDFFAGSGTTGEVCIELGREFILIDNNPEAIGVMKSRFAKLGSSDDLRIEWR